MDIVKALKELNHSLNVLSEETQKISNTQKVIDDAIKEEIEQRKKEAKELINRIKLS